MDQLPLKHRTARSVKWNIIDRVSSQILYAVTGVILARQLSQEAFGLIGALLVFQSFAMLFVDSGFSFALIQRKHPTDQDYSSVFWFNLSMACGIYIILWFAAPFIASCFQNDQRLIPLSRVMFLSFIINALAIVQTNRLMKQMNVRPIAITNTIALICGGISGIWLACADYGAWAIVWQTITLNLVKTAGLWIYCRWTPMMKVSWKSLKSFFSIGGGMMMTSFLNVLFQNIYSFFIGNRTGLVQLGYYSQADKWSKLGITSVSQVLTSSFLPALSEVQDDRDRFRHVVSKMNRFTGYILFPAIGFLIVMATPVFHVLFGTKWDASVILFQLLLVRGIFTILNTLYNNYILALGHSKTIFRLEVFRDSVALAGIVVTLPMINLSTPDNAVAGLTIFMIGQVAASLLTWIATLWKTARITGMNISGFLSDLFPYMASSLAIMAALYGLSLTGLPDLPLLLIQAFTALLCYIAVNSLFPSKIQREVLSQIFPNFKKDRQKK